MVRLPAPSSRRCWRCVSVNAFLACGGSGEASAGRPSSSASVATVWALSPLHDGALAWCAVHGEVILTTITLLLLARLRYLDDSARPLQWSEALAAG